MVATEWHLGLRAWNVGHPPFPDEPELVPLEQELTDFLVALQDDPPSAPLVGRDGTLGPAIESGVVQILEQEGEYAAAVVGLLARPDLEQLFAPLDGELDDCVHQLGSDKDDRVRRKLLADIAKPLAAGAILVNSTIGLTPFSGVVTTGWLVAAAARCSARLPLRERIPILSSLEQEVRLACDAVSEGLNPDPAALRLAQFVHATMVRGESRR